MLITACHSLVATSSCCCNTVDICTCLVLRLTLNCSLDVNLPNTYGTKCGSTDTKKFFRLGAIASFTCMAKLHYTKQLANKLATSSPTSSCLVHQTRTSCTTCWLVNSIEPTWRPICWALARPALNRLYTCLALVLPGMWSRVSRPTQGLVSVSSRTT
jgi:hypothetical protein